MNFASLYNYYEHLVFDYISRQLTQKYTDKGEDFFLDVACYSLTRLPSRYIRHEIDMVYYMAPGEHDVWSHKQLLKVVSHTPPEVEHWTASVQCPIPSKSVENFLEKSLATLIPQFTEL